MTELPRYRTHIGLSEVRPSPTNPRKNFPEAELAELADSIREHGVVTPILIRLADGGAAMYELISGERRWRAAKLAGLTTIPAIVRDDLSPAAVIEIQLIENLQRQDLHPLEEAEGYGRMMREHGYTAETLAEMKACKEALAAAEKAKKPAKKPKKTKSAPSDDHLPPTEAAPAAGIDRGKATGARPIETDEKPPAAKRPPVQYRHPENNELEWTGRGRKPKWVEHWLATEGNTLDDLKTEGAAA